MPRLTILNGRSDLRTGEIRTTLDIQELLDPPEIQGRPKKGHLLRLFAENLEPACFNLLNLQFNTEIRHTPALAQIILLKTHPSSDQSNQLPAVKYSLN